MLRRELSLEYMPGARGAAEPFEREEYIGRGTMEAS